MITRYFAAAICCLMMAGCSASSGLTTGSLIGDSAKNSTAAAVPVVQNDPMTRALHVGAVSARAVRCGFHFDAPKLKSDFMAAETAAGVSVGDIAKVGNAYSVGFNGVAKAIDNAQTYCSPGRVAGVKAALTRYLGGDYTPPPAKKVVKTDGGGIFGGLFDGDLVDDGPKFGSQEWWDSQNEKTGG